MDDIIQKYMSDYNILSKGKHSYINSIGCITFIKTHSIITVYEIYIESKYQNKGYCRQFIMSMIQNGKTFIIVSVISRILYEYLLRFQYKGYRFRLVKDGFLLTI
jgi:hypothetical protein